MLNHDCGRLPQPHVRRPGTTQRLKIAVQIIENGK